MAKRKAPTNRAVTIAMPAEDKHEGMLHEMHDALYALGDKIRKPFNSSGQKLLPKKLQAQETPEAKQARDHIGCLYKAMSEEK